MDNSAVAFYVRHRKQITQWAALRDKAEAALRDSVARRSFNDASALVAADTGERDIDFYTRHRALIEEWDALQAEAGQELHRCLLRAGADAGCETSGSGASFRTVSLALPESAKVGRGVPRVELLWMKRDLLSSRAANPFPRIALALEPQCGDAEVREAIRSSAEPIARDFGMVRKTSNNIHDPIGRLDEIGESETVGSYAIAAVARLKTVSEALDPVVAEVTGRTQ